MDPDTERATVAGLKAGDSAAFDRAYAAYRQRIFAFIARMTGRRDVAEDLFQETWLRLCRKAHTLDDDTRLGPWLFTVARHVCVDHLRWSALDAERIDQLGLQTDGERISDTPFQVVAVTETRRRLERALGALPVHYREVVLLVVVDHLSPADAAQVLAIEPSALRQRLSRARAALAAELAAGGLVPRRSAS